MKKRFRFYDFNSEDSIHHSLYLFGVNCWSMYFKEDFMWIRIFGKGLLVKNTKTYALSFGEKNNHQNGFKIGNWYFRYLRKNSKK